MKRDNECVVNSRGQLLCRKVNDYEGADSSRMPDTGIGATQSITPHSRHNTLKSDTVSKVRHTQATVE